MFKSELPNFVYFIKTPFFLKFLIIEWNTIENGIQRVDACKTKDGQLLLVELEDLNPYLSLLELNEETVEIFINDLVDAINDL